jgi:hypothetical protein
LDDELWEYLDLLFQDFINNGHDKTLAIPQKKLTIYNTSTVEAVQQEMF